MVLSKPYGMPGLGQTPVSAYVPETISTPLYRKPKELRPLSQGVVPLLVTVARWPGTKSKRTAAPPLGTGLPLLSLKQVEQ